MSRVGNMPVKIPEKVKVSVDKNLVKVEGPKGKMSFPFNPRVAIAVDKVRYAGEPVAVVAATSRAPRAPKTITRKTTKLTGPASMLWSSFMNLKMRKIRIAPGMTSKKLRMSQKLLRTDRR